MATEQEVKSFIDRFAPIAQRIEAIFGIPASVVLGQAAVESGWGTSGSARNDNAYFGVKGKGDAGTEYRNTTEYINGSYVAQVAGFAKWSSPEASFVGYGEFLRDNPRYKKAGVFSSKDPDKVLSSIAAAGYATDPHYFDTVKSVIDGRDLTRYDLTSTGGSFLPHPSGAQLPETAPPMPTVTIDTSDKRLQELEDAKRAIADAKKAGYLPNDKGVITFPIDVAQKFPSFTEGNSFLQDLIMLAMLRSDDEGGGNANPSAIADDANIGQQFQLSLTGKILRGLFILVLVVGLILIVVQAMPQAQAIKNIAKGAAGQ